MGFAASLTASQHLLVLLAAAGTAFTRGLTEGAGDSSPIIMSLAEQDYHDLVAKRTSTHC